MSPSSSSIVISRILHLCSSNQTQRVISSFNSLDPTLLRNLEPNTYVTFLQFCIRHRLLFLGQFLHKHIPLDFSSSDETKRVATFLCNHFVNMYCKCYRPDLARRIFDEMPSRNLVSWTALLTGYNQNGWHEECFGVFLSMVRNDFVPNDFGFVGVLSSCAEATCGDLGRQVHGMVLNSGFGDDNYVNNALISMYCRCYGDRDGWDVFQTMKWRNSISWNAMISGLTMNGSLEKSTELFVFMLRDGVKIDHATLISIFLAGCSLNLCLQLHGIAVKTSYVLEVEVVTAIVKAYSAAGGDVSDCYRVFLEAREHDTMSWTGIITTYAECDPETALALFRKLLSYGVVPDRHVFSTVVKACAGLATERHGASVHSLVLKSGFENDVTIGNALIHTYARCGSIKLSERIFKEMVSRDIVSWNSMIKAYAMHGRANDALRVFSSMSTDPDSTTFASLLSSCSHSGLVNEGRKLFKVMFDEHGISPELGHYACMVDILGRVGHLSEAEELINNMPMEPDSVIWITLLGACRKHKETDIGERATKKLMELQSISSAGYVLMSNIYYEGGNFSDAAFVRKGMRERGVKKEPGLSWIEVHNRVHEFAVGGQRHPQIEDIYAELKIIVDKMKEVGYVAETSLVLHETEEEHKEERILLHGEKLAFVYGLMNASPSQTCLKIMKNIRTCIDCHNFMKIASKLTNKEIILRDTNRFHDFKCGTCSCGDYWRRGSTKVHMMEQAKMGALLTTPPLHIFFFPLMAPGHIIPMTNMAVIFSHRGVRSTVITTPANSDLINHHISGNPVNLLLLQFPQPKGCQESLTSPAMSLGFFKSLEALRGPFRTLVSDHRPNCVVSDMYLPWTVDVAEEFGIPRLVFHGMGFFPICVLHRLEDGDVDIDTEPVVITGLPHRIVMKRSQIHNSVFTLDEFGEYMKRIAASEGKSYGVIFNSFYELEPDYVDHFKNELKRKAWHVGPIRPSQITTINNDDRKVPNWVRWLDSQEKESVIYACFGTLSRLTQPQLLEIKLGLEASNHPYLWVVGGRESPTETKTEKGMIVHGWVPQVLVLNHECVGGFLTHCGWNSVMEAVSAGVPMVTWPLCSEQFYNERLVVEVLDVGVAVGAEEWGMEEEEKRVVKRDEIERAVRCAMDGGDVAKNRRMRMVELKEKARMAVEVGGSSDAEIGRLIMGLTEIRRSLLVEKSQSKVSPEVQEKVSQS